MGLSKLSERYSRLSLRWKILLPFLTVSVAVSCTGAWVLGNSLEEEVYEQADKEVSQEAKLAASYLEREEAFIVSQLTLAVEEGMMLIGDDADLLDVMAQLDMATIMRMLGFGSDSAVQVDLVKIVGSDGSSVLELHREMLTGRTLDDDALIGNLIQGEGSGGAVTTNDGRSAYLVGAARFPVEGPLKGILMLGTKVDRQLLCDIGLADRTLLVFTDQGIAACSDRDYDAGWEEALASAGGSRVKLAGKPYSASAAPVYVDGAPSAVSVAALMSLDSLAGQVAGDWARTWLIFAGGAALLVLAGLVITRRALQPVHELTVATTRLRDGDLDARIAVERADEIGVLAQAFNTMGEELKTRDARLAESFNEVKRLSETDALTGLLNHRTINERLTMELARAQRYGGRFGLIVIDLDNFKLLNDTYGHPVGDDALRGFARLLVEHTREVDHIGRHGGDEFMVVLPECGLTEIAGAVEKLRSVVTDSAFAAPDGSCFPLRMSLGVACYPEDGHDVNTLIALADANLYLSKSRGGNTVSGAHMDDLSAEDLTAYGMMGSLVTIVDNKDRYTRHHSEEVTQYAVSLGEALGLSEESVRVLRVSGLLHDIGKVGVPDRILRKPGRLTEEEYEVIKQHSVLGDAIIAAIPDLGEIRSAVLSHHERYDGTGYPNQLSGEQIPLMARILAVADAYSAMITDRPYRKARGRPEAIAELLAQKGSQFDPICVDVFVRVLREQEDRVKSGPTLAASER